MVRRKTTVKPEQAILKAIGKNGETEQYRLPEKTNFSYRTILRTLKILEKKELVNVARTEPSEKGGKEKKIYSLTLKGLHTAIIKLDLLNEDPELLKDKWGHMLPILKNYQLFKKHDLDGFFRYSLRDTLILRTAFPETNRIGSIEEKFCKKMYDLTLYTEFEVNFDRILHEDPDLMNHARGAVRNRIETGVVMLIDYAERLELVFPELDKERPDWDRIQAVEKWIVDHKRRGYPKNKLVEVVESLIRQEFEKFEAEKAG